MKACLGFLETHPADLIVLAVHQRQASPLALLKKSVGEPIVRGAGQMTLFIPQGGTLLRLATGWLGPAANDPDSNHQQTFSAAGRGSCLAPIRNLQLPAGTVTLLHVGSAAEMPSAKLPENTGWTWNCVTKTGEPADTILQTSTELGADLIVMTTDGPDGFLDGLGGTISSMCCGRHAVRWRICRWYRCWVEVMISNGEAKVATATRA